MFRKKKNKTRKKLLTAALIATGLGGVGLGARALSMRSNKKVTATPVAATPASIQRNRTTSNTNRLNDLRKKYSKSDFQNVAKRIPKKRKKLQSIAPGMRQRVKRG
jgi:hypothetical protein